MAERFYDILTQAEKDALDNVGAVLDTMTVRGFISGFQSNNLDSDVMRGVVDYWVTTKNTDEPIPLCVADGRRNENSLVIKNPGLPIIITVEKGKRKNLNAIQDSITRRINYYVKNGMSIQKLLEDKKERLLEMA